MTTFGQPLDVGGADLALLNAEEADLGAPRSPVLAVRADAHLGLEAVTNSLRPRPLRSSWADEELASAQSWVDDQLADLAPQRGWLAAIRQALPDNGVFVSEFTQVGYAAGVCFPTHHQHGFVGPGYQGTLGFGFATALGVQAPIRRAP